MSANESTSFDDALAEIEKDIQLQPIWPLSLWQKLQQLANQHIPISSFSDYHDSGSNWEIACERYYRIANMLSLHREPHLAHRIVQKWWGDLSSEQQKTKKRYPLAVPIRYLSKIFVNVNDLGLAFRWILLAAAHDAQNGMDDSLALQELQATFGFSEQATQKLISLARQCCKETEGDWSKPCAFPEEVIQRLIKSSEESITYTEHIALHITRHEIAPSPGYLKSLLHRLNEVPTDKDEKNQKEKGERLEIIARYLTSLLPGCVPRSNLLSSDKAFESDIIVANVYSQPTIISDLFGRYILVECKNYAKPVNVSRVGYFLHRMRMVHASFGIIFATSGITGDKTEDEEKAARSLIRRSFHEDSSICIVIDNKDLEKIKGGKITFYWLLHSRYEEFRFGNPTN